MQLLEDRRLENEREEARVRLLENIENIIVSIENDINSIDVSSINKDNLSDMERWVKRTKIREQLDDINNTLTIFKSTNNTRNRLFSFQSCNRSRRRGSYPCCGECRQHRTWGRYSQNYAMFPWSFPPGSFCS